MKDAGSTMNRRRHDARRREARTRGCPLVRSPAVPQGPQAGESRYPASVLDAARATFAELGFTGASIRKIASTAGVDAALVHHYFGSKEKLFLATVEVPSTCPR